MLTEEQKFIEEIYQERAKNDANTKSLANTVRSIINDNLAGNNYISELLQNADDVGSPSVEFILTGDSLIFKHKGKHFNQEEIQGICDTANPDRQKVTASDQIGNKGIGFKSVFSMASTVTIISKQYSFSFDEMHEGWQGNPKNYPWQMIPIWTEQQDLPNKIQPYCDVESVNFIFKIRDGGISEIKNHLEKLTSRHFLFLRCIKKANILIKSDFLDQEDIKQEIILKSLAPPFKLKDEDDFTISELSSNASEKFYIYEKKYSFPPELINQLKTTKEEIPGKYKSLTELPISIGIFVEKGKLKPASTGQQVFCYLPTGIDLGLKILVNAEFLLNTSRMQFRDGSLADAWNGFLLEKIFYGQIEFLSALNMLSNQWPNIFDVLSRPQSVPEQFKANCESAFKQAIKDSFLVTNLSKENGLKVEQSIIDHYGFIAKFGDKDLQENCVHPNTSSQNLLKELGAKFFFSSDIIKAIQEPWFLEKIKEPHQNREFIDFFTKLDRRITDAKTKENLSNSFKQGRFILSSRNELKAPSEIYFPEESLEYLTSEFSFVDTIHEALNQSAAKSWLGTMGVQVLQIEHIIRVANEAIGELIPFTLHIAGHATRLPEETQKKLKGLKVRTRSGKIVPAINGYLPGALQPETAIEKFIGANNEFLLHEDYLTKGKAPAYKKFLISLGVQQTINPNNLAQIVEAINRANDAEKLMAFTQYVFKKFYTGKNQETQQKTLKSIEKLKLVSQNNEIVSADSCYLADMYAPKQPLEKYVSELAYISQDYAQDQDEIENWKQFFLGMRVQEKIKVEVLTGWRISDLEKDPIANEYLQANRARVNPWYKYTSRNYLEGNYVKIEFVNAIINTEIFWKMLIEHWNMFAPGINNVKYNGNTTTNIESNIHYLAKKAFKNWCRENAQISDYYGVFFKEKLGSYASKLRIAHITEGLDAKQQCVLGFKANLSLQDCQNIFNAIADTDDWQDDFEKITFVYEHLLYHAKQDETIKLNEDEDIQLLNQTGRFASAGLLHYIVDDDNRLPNLQNSNFIKKPGSFTSANFQKICHLMNVNVIAYNDLMIEGEELESTLKQHIENRLNYVIYLEADKKALIGKHHQSTRHELKEDIEAKLNNVTFFCSNCLQVTYGEILAEPIDLWIDKDKKTIYHCPQQSLELTDQQQLYRFLYTYLGITFSDSDFISIMTIPEEKIKVKYQSRLGQFTIEDFADTTKAMPSRKIAKVHKLDSTDDLQAEAKKVKRTSFSEEENLEEEFNESETNTELEDDMNTSEHIESAHIPATQSSTPILPFTSYNIRPLQTSANNKIPKTANNFDSSEPKKTTIKKRFTEIDKLKSYLDSHEIEYYLEEETGVTYLKKRDIDKSFPDCVKSRTVLLVGEKSFAFAYSYGLSHPRKTSATIATAYENWDESGFNDAESNSLVHRTVLEILKQGMIVAFNFDATRMHEYSLFKESERFERIQFNCPYVEGDTKDLSESTQDRPKTKKLVKEFLTSSRQLLNPTTGTVHISIQQPLSSPQPGLTWTKERYQLAWGLTPVAVLESGLTFVKAMGDIENRYKKKVTKQLEKDQKPIVEYESYLGKGPARRVNQFIFKVAHQDFKFFDYDTDNQENSEPEV